VPVIGLGTSGAFDVGDTPADRADVEEVLKRFFAAGATLIDTAPSYGRAETVVGDLVAKLKPPRRFLATKVSASGTKPSLEQMDRSFRALRTSKIDLMQIHSLKDWQAHSTTLREMKEKKKFRYIGITHSQTAAQPQLEAALRADKWDWVQLNYSIQTRDAEQSLLPLAQELGVAVMVNRPFEDGAIFKRVEGKPLPAWAEEIGCTTWGQFFLKYVISHPAVTCVIPATARPEHISDNLQAGRGVMPAENYRAEMVRYFESVTRTISS
jgi:aryl-alcohol dehydrogenase-like predicted oxidoreductase